jgi:hypothetical protein
MGFQYDMLRTHITKILRNPLLHFCFIGGVLFAVAPGARRTVELSRATLDTLRAAESARNTAAPFDEVRAREVDARAIEDEMLYREALRMSLDKGDPIVRQRLVQKLLLLVEDLGGASRAPTEAEMRAYFESTRERWRRPERIHFIHVFAGRLERLPSSEALPPGARGAPALGEAFPHAREVTATAEEIARVYGAEVKAALERQNGAWGDPVRSSFGWHRLRVIERVPGREATFEEARKELELDFLLARREKIVGGYLRKLAASYEIRVDGRKVSDFVPTRRVAIRVDPSAED